MQTHWIGNLQQSNKPKHKTSKINMNTKDMLRNVIGITMTQISKEDRYAHVSINEGIKRHGQKAIDAVLAEFMQLNDQKVFKPVVPNSLNDNDKREALNLITMLKEKRNGKVKGHACADGRKQCRYIDKDKVSSPTVQLESLMLTLLVK